MAGLSGSGAIDLLNGARNNWTHLSAHSADPLATGANEIGSVTRQAITWDSGGPVTSGTTCRLDTDAAIVFTNTSGSPVTITHVGFWTASSSGTFKDSIALSTSKTLQQNETVTIATNQLAITLPVSA
jgi:hypothetical protein